MEELTPEKIIQVLNESSYLGMLKWRPGSEGLICKTTHTAEIEYRDGNTETSFVKIFASKIELFNEVIGYLIAKAIGLPVANEAAVIKIPSETLKFAELESNTANLYEWAWAVSEVPGVSPKVHFKFRNSIGLTKALIKDVQKWSDLHGTVAFDDFVFNTDRNLENFLRIGKSKYVLIDHGNLLGGKPIWAINDLFSLLRQSTFNLYGLCHNKLSARAWDNNIPDCDQQKVLDSCMKHDFTVRTYSSEIEFWCGALLSLNQKKHFNRFISFRAKNGPSRVKSVFGMLL